MISGKNTVHSSAGDLIDPVTMPASLKWRVHECIQHFSASPSPDKTGRYAEYIGVVMFAGKGGQFVSPANCGTDVHAWWP